MDPMNITEKTALSITVAIVTLLAVSGLIVSSVANGEIKNTGTQSYKLIQTKTMNVQSLKIGSSDDDDSQLFSFPTERGINGQVFTIDKDSLQSEWKDFEFLRVQELPKQNSIIVFSDESGKFVKNSLASISNQSELNVKKATFKKDDSNSSSIYTLPISKGSNGQVVEYKTDKPCIWVQIAGVGLGDVKSENAEVTKDSLCFFSDKSGKIISSLGPTLSSDGIIASILQTETKKISTDIFSLPTIKGDTLSQLTYDADNKSLLFQKEADGNLKLASSFKKQNEIPILLADYDPGSDFLLQTSGVQIKNSILYTSEVTSLDKNKIQGSEPSEDMIISSKTLIKLGHKNKLVPCLFLPFYSTSNFQTVNAGGTAQDPSQLTGAPVVRISGDSLDDSFFKPPTITNTTPSGDFKVNPGCIIDISNSQKNSNVILSNEFVRRSPALATAQKNVNIYPGTTQRIISLQLNTGEMVWICSI